MTEKELTVHPLGPAQERDPGLEDAFRELHGSRLHGFAMLVTLGESQSAGQAAGEALAAGAEQATKLRHPERAAAWLRARTLRALQHGGSRRETVPDSARRAVLATLGVDEAVYRGLAALSIEARAGLVASAIERFEPIDIETILGSAPSATRRVIADARGRYLRVLANLHPGQPGGLPDFPDGALASRVRAVAAWALSGGPAT